LTERIRLHSLETVVFVAVILLLTLGTYSRNRLWNDEIRLWTDCVKKSPNKGRPYVYLGVAYFSAGIYDKSLETIRKAVEIDAKSAEGYANLGLVYQKMGDLNNAIMMEKKALEADPTLKTPYYSLGQFYFENGQYEESEKAFQRFIKTYPYMPEVHNLLALVYFAQKKFDKAVVELEWELKINPYYTLARINLGRIYWYEFRNREKALYHLRAALLLDPFLPNRMEIQRLARLLEGLPQ